MSNDKMREEFEAWLGIKPCGAAHDLAWDAWKAARAQHVAAIDTLSERVEKHCENRHDCQPAGEEVADFLPGMWDWADLEGGETDCADTTNEAMACPDCKGTGSRDSGGSQPWGEPIMVPCGCQITAQPADNIDTIKEDRDRNERMFLAACQTLAQISDALGLDSDDSDPESLLDAIAELKAYQPAGEAVAWRLFKQAMFVGMAINCTHYLVANAHGRRDGAMKAHRHDLLCRHVVAAVRGCDIDWVRSEYGDDYNAVHDGTRALTDRLDEVIGFPLDDRPDYVEMVPKFFDKFFELAMSALGITAPTSQVQDGWMLVPVEPTFEMLKAIDQHGEYYSEESLKDAYMDMLSASPQPKGGE